MEKKKAEQEVVVEKVIKEGIVVTKDEGAVVFENERVFKRGDDTVKSEEGVDAIKMKEDMIVVANAEKSAVFDGKESVVKVGIKAEAVGQDQSTAMHKEIKELDLGKTFPITRAGDIVQGLRKGIGVTRHTSLNMFGSKELVKDSQEVEIIIETEHSIQGLTLGIGVMWRDKESSSSCTQLCQLS